MFDFAWSEIALIGVVALIAIGPKDMPVAIKAVTGAIKKARKMAAEFQTHVDDLVKDADLHEVRNSIAEIRRFDLKGAVERAVDPDGSLRTTLASNPLSLDPEPAIHAPSPVPPVDAETAAAAVALPSAAEPGSEYALAHDGALPPPDAAADLPAATETTETSEVHAAPAFIPPAFGVRAEPPPDFVPPNVKRRSAAHV